jgi:hypothetical protein
LNCSARTEGKPPMLATVATIALFGFAVAMLARFAWNDGGKILAALSGNSWLAQPPASVRPVTVRFSQRYPASRPMRVRPAMRAAA